MQLHQV